MATNWNLPGSIALASCRSEGSSSRQGGHHVAQKFSRTTFPRYAERSTGLPSRAGSEKDGAAAARSSSASIAPAARFALPPKCCTALLTPTTPMAISAKATNASFSQRGTTQVRRAALGMLE